MRPAWAVHRPYIKRKRNGKRGEKGGEGGEAVKKNPHILSNRKLSNIFSIAASWLFRKQ